jgi:hypothetical protein
MNSTTIKRTRKPRVAKVAQIRESRLVLFGNNSDVEVKESIRKAKISGRQIELVARPSFDTGLGQCGKHLCSCKSVCMKEYAAKTTGAYPGDQGATIGMTF